jgi:hypothetical protein
MEIYRKFTCLRGNDRHVLIKYESEFYEFSPESITNKKALNNDKSLYGDKDNMSRQ